MSHSRAAQQNPDQVREQVRQQVQQAQAQAAQARAQAAEAQAQARDAVRQAMQDVQDAQGGTPVPPVPPVPMGRTGTIQMPPGGFIPPQAVHISYAFFIMVAVIIVGWPIARALGRRLERGPSSRTLDDGAAARLERIEHSVEAIAIEVERISEAQRYMARLQAPAASVSPSTAARE